MKILHRQSLSLPLLNQHDQWKSCQMQARILCFGWLEILGLVGNFELKTFPKDGELWIEILPQGAGSLTPNFCFWSKSHPILLSPLGHNIVSAFQNGCILREDSSSKWRSWFRSSGDAVKICFFFIVIIRLFSSFLILKGCGFNGWNTHRSLLFLLSRQNICYCFSIWKNG